MTTRNYPKAPIVEAIVDFQTRFPEDHDFSCLQQFAALVSDEFPVTSPIFILDVIFNDGPDSAQSQKTNHGIRLSTPNNAWVLQVQKRGFTLSQLHPYRDWDTLKKQAEKYWQLFVEICKPSHVTRCAVRYINRVTVPVGDLKDYFNVYPTLPLEVKGSVSNMFLQLQLPQPDLGYNSTAALGFALTEPAVADRVTYILDIDINSLYEFEAGSAQVWTLLESFRARKNELFEASITDKTRREFE